MRTSFATIDTAISTHAWISQSIAERGNYRVTKIEFDIIIDFERPTSKSV
jgi:hypothetical protein